MTFIQRNKYFHIRDLSSSAGLDIIMCNFKKYNIELCSLFFNIQAQSQLELNLTITKILVKQG